MCCKLADSVICLILEIKSSLAKSWLFNTLKVSESKCSLFQRMLRLDPIAYCYLCNFVMKTSENVLILLRFFIHQNKTMEASRLVDGKDAECSGIHGSLWLLYNFASWIIIRFLDPSKDSLRLFFCRLYPSVSTLNLARPHNYFSFSLGTTLHSPQPCIIPLLVSIELSTKTSLTSASW